MRILQLLEATTTGAGRHVVDLTEGLLARGHEVHLVFSPLRSDAVFRDDLKRISNLPGFRSFPLPIRRNPSVHDILAVKRLRRYVHACAPFDLVHCHGTKAGWIGRAGLIGHSVKCLHTPHGFLTMDRSYDSASRWLAGKLEKVLTMLGVGVIVVSREEHDHALGLGIPPRKLRIIPNGVSPKPMSAERSAHRSTWGLLERDLCIGFVGRLTAVKAPDIMLESFAAFRRESRLPAKLVVVGDGPLLETLRGQASRLGLGQDVVWLGARHARPLMGAFDVLCLTSNSEGHSLAVLEAMASGLPIIATQVGGISDTVRPDLNGFIVPVRGVNEIAAALRSLAGDIEMRERMGRASRALSRNFSLEKMIDQTIDYYQQLVYGPGALRTVPDLKIASSR